MGNLSLRILLLILLLPAVVSAAALDDYYLARLGYSGSVARALVDGTATTGYVERCATPLHRQLKKDWSKLESSTQKVLAKELARPTYLATEYIYSLANGHFTIHYAKSGSDAPDLTDADNDGVPDWVEKVAAVFENVYNVEVTQMGYRSPISSRYDVYLKNLLYQGAYGFTTDDGVPTYPSTSTTSYIQIDKAFTDPSYTYNGQYTAEQLLQVTAAHEFHHAIQYGYNYYFETTFAEMTSTWMEDEVYDSVNQSYRYLSSYLPMASYLALNAYTYDNSRYGRWIFNRYLTEAHTSSIMRDAWVKIGATPAPSTGDDIPMTPILQSVISNYGSTLATDFLGFAKRVILKSWTSHTNELGLIPSVDPQATYTSYPVDLSAIKAKLAALPSYTFAYYRFVPGSSAPSDLSLAFSTVPAGVEVVAVKKGSDGSLTEYSLDRSSGTITIPSFNSVATSEVDLILCNSSGDSSAVAVASGSSKGGGCFIATAAYGSYLHPKVALLRDFRDRHLLTNAPGRLFVSLYYRFSPPVARIIAEHAWMRAAVRMLLTPVVAAVEYPAVAVIVMMMCGGGMMWRRRARLAATRKIKTAIG